MNMEDLGVCILLDVIPDDYGRLGWMNMEDLGGVCLVVLAELLLDILLLSVLAESVARGKSVEKEGLGHVSGDWEYFPCVCILEWD